jgi:uncharacterized protein with GYD domain
MPHYIILGNFTEQGIKNVRQAPKRDEEARRMIEQAGGKMNIYYTLGEYDFVAMTEMSDDESIMKFLLQAGSLGNVRTKTLKAWTESDSKKVISQL